jgi:formylglycine-generating enzyme required for sulfatase activity
MRQVRRLAFLAIGSVLSIATSVPGPWSDVKATSAATHRVVGFRDCAVICPEMVGLPSGQFVIGSPKNEKGRFDDEDQKTVTVHAFAIGKYPVTRGQWATFVKATGRTTPKADCAYAASDNPSWRDPGFPQGDDHPVVCVSWNDAKDYVRWLSQRTGKVYRLPTDVEREYAARAGSKTAFPWGSVASHEFANYGLDQCCGRKVEGRDKWMATSPVGSFPPNSFGLFDMHGNIFEWVETCADGAENPKDFPRPKDAKGCYYRWGRGGAYGERPAVMRSAAKNPAPPPGDAMTCGTYRSLGFGLRVVRSMQ